MVYFIVYPWVGSLALAWGYSERQAGRLESEVSVIALIFGFAILAWRELLKRVRRDRLLQFFHEVEMVDQIEAQEIQVGWPAEAVLAAFGKPREIHQAPAQEAANQKCWSFPRVGNGTTQLVVLLENDAVCKWEESPAKKSFRPLLIQLWWLALILLVSAMFLIKALT